MITIINKFLAEKQPNKKMELKTQIKQQDKTTFDNIMQRLKITLNNKKYFYNDIKNKYELAK